MEMLYYNVENRMRQFLLQVDLHLFEVSFALVHIMRYALIALIGYCGYLVINWFRAIWENDVGMKVGEVVNYLLYTFDQYPKSSIAIVCFIIYQLAKMKR